MGVALDLTGRRFGQLVALKPVDSSVMRRAWLCECDCGTTKPVRTDALMRGNTKSCGNRDRHRRANPDGLLFYGPLMPRELAIEKGLKWYVSGSACPYGHVCERQVRNWACRECVADKNAANCKQWYENKGRDQVIAAAKNWVKQHPNKRKEIANRYAAAMRADPIKNALHNKRRREGNRYELHRIRYQEDANYRLLIGLKARIKCALKLQSGRKAYKTAALLGCTLPEFKKWIASQFSGDMSWDNYAYETWHLDHIRPCASFDLTDPAQQLVCFSWANQQPLPASENMSKSDEWTAEMEEAWIKHMRSHRVEGDLFLCFEETKLSS